MVATDILRKIHRSGLITKPLRFISQRYGENIYNRDWDILIILDAARYEIVKDLSNEFNYIESVDRLKSRGSHSSEWCYNTFVKDFSDHKSDIRKTNYITGNVISSLILNGASDTEFLDDKSYIKKAMGQEGDHERIKRLKSYHPVWKGSLDLDDEFIPPDLLTNKFIDYRSNIADDDRTIFHYMQPHTPFVGADSEVTRVWPNNSDKVSMFNMDDDIYRDLMSNYRDNHRYILNHLRVLLDKIPDEKEVILSADHGNITNRSFGVPYTLGHPNYIFFSSGLRHVPWVEVDQSRVDTSGVELKDINYEQKDYTDQQVMDRLESLGYK